MTEEVFYVEGRRGVLVQVQTEIYERGRVVVTAERERLSDAAFRRALKENYPGTRFERLDDKYIFKAFVR